MYEYIKNEAKKQALNGVAVLDDQLVYSLAIHYFDESNEALGLNKKTEELQLLKKEPENTISVTSTKKSEEDNQLSFFNEGGAA